MKKIQITTIRFPQIRLSTRDAHKLRGYFAEMYREKSDLLHNHNAEGESIYRGPLVQYKVLRNVPTLVGIGKGATLLLQLFTQIKELNIEGQVYPILSKDIKTNTYEIGVNGDLYRYEFETPWLGLNQENYKDYMGLNLSQKREKLLKILKGNILSFFKGQDYWEEGDIMMNVSIRETARGTQFKNQTMKTFIGSFTTNVKLPEAIGLGQSVSRGFGTVRLAN